MLDLGFIRSPPPRDIYGLTGSSCWSKRESLIEAAPSTAAERESLVTVSSGRICFGHLRSEVELDLRSWVLLRLENNLLGGTIPSSIKNCSSLQSLISLDTDSGEATSLDIVGHERILLSISSLIAVSAAAAIVIGVIAITVLHLRVRATTASRSALPIALSGGMV
ncbi:hypothetical protein F2Q70_00030259 [Brassica cretica]|uniref:Leucine-rich repeat-containing N-terminal plant-type domain-containing protein n=1 Tax=Brassica cretica TaxID=69181 RepID=A0A8S9FKA1_BRACR|nr:hypothetical protein F2Q70_00030259 [Brassica cretica]